MQVSAKTPGPMRATVVEWRAARIEDPIERLRFLRATTGGQTPVPPRRAWQVAMTAVLWASFLIPSYSPSTARSRIINSTPIPVGTTELSIDPRVWPVEQNLEFDLYSNGLRVENEFVTHSKPRTRYPVFAAQPKNGEPVEWQSQPVGIVFHSTESHQFPFEPSEVRSITRIGRNLLSYVQQQRSYHFVIDRFGRVWRVVAEGDVANHAGKSVWSDRKAAWVNLNASFLSVAFEAQTDSSVPLSSAQLHAARILIDMLRSKYSIPAANCVTHAQVSVNPSNLRIGYHTDWAEGFPFGALGLPDNYRQPVASIALFGFDYDTTFLQAAGRPWPGLAAAEQKLAERARAQGVDPGVYRRALQDRYRQIINSDPMRSNEDNQDEKQ